MVEETPSSSYSLTETLKNKQKLSELALSDSGQESNVYNNQVIIELRKKQLKNMPGI